MSTALPPANLLILMSDEHNPKVMGCAGHPFIRTPHLDRLAARGTRFGAAYTASPICVPARAAFALGKYNHQAGYWDNVDAYEGAAPSWHHLLRERGHDVVSIGKLHFRGLQGDDHGLSEEIVPMHIFQGRGDIKMLIRNPPPLRKGGLKLARSAGPGESSYTVYDRDIAARAQVWLHERGERRRREGPPERPWVLFVSLVAPHFPLTAPPEHYYEYWQRELPMPKLYAQAQRPRHPYVRDYAEISMYDQGFDGPQSVKRALAGYFGLVSAMDENVGKVLAALDRSGLEGETRVLYTSDHGDNNGARGLWGKSTMYEESAGVPMILAGPAVPAGRLVSTPASHVDVLPLALQCVGADNPGGYPGVSLLELAREADRERTVLSEYHTVGAKSAVFMVRDARYKYVHYLDGYPPQLFDLARDPEELVDLGADPASSALVAAMQAKLRAFCDPDEVDRRAKRRQMELLERFGGYEVAMQAGDLGYTPAPGSRPDFNP
jgi:choline-sulfatase